MVAKIRALGEICKRIFRLPWKYRSMRSVLLVYFLAIIAIPFVSLGLLGPIIYTGKLQVQMESYMVQMLGQVTKNIDYHIQEMDKLCALASGDPDARLFFRAGIDHVSAVRIRENLEGIARSHPEIAGLLLVNHYDETISGELQRLTRDSLLTEPWYATAVGNPGATCLFPRPLGRNIRAAQAYEAENVVSVVHAITETPGASPLGVVLIDVKLSVIEDIFTDTRLGRSGFFFILDSMNEIVYTPINDIVFRVNPAWLAGEAVNTVREIRGRQYQIISLESPYTHWRTVGVFPLEDMQREVQYLRTYSLIVALATIILSVLASFFFSDSIARPVVRLRELMGRVESGDLSVRYQDRGHDELDRLGSGFNSMLEKIEKLIELVYHEQKNMREAELKILQAQIKPHFLYNTLDTIHWMAKEHDAVDVADLVAALAKLFRLGLSSGREVISVRDELEHVRSYLVIQKVRYEEKFDYEIAVPESLMDRGILKVILQPLVENAIYHGVKEIRGKGEISIRASVEDGALLFRVNDNGVGIDSLTLEALNRRLEEESIIGDGPGYALFNVNARIKLSAGQEYGLRIESRVGEGTEVFMRLPLQEAGDVV